MESTKSTGEMEKIKAKWTQVTLKNVLKVKDPKLSRVLIVQNKYLRCRAGTIGEDRLQETCINNKEIANMFRVSVKS